MKNGIKIHVALASDDNYFEGLLTTAWSIARNCTRPAELVVHILDGGISDAHWELLVARLETHGCSINRLTVNQKESFGTFKTYRGNGRMTYARLLLPDLLPDVENIVYSDVDIVWAVDIAELYDSLDSNAVLHYVPKGGPIIPSEIEWFERNGFEIEDGARFCAGMIVMNLRLFREESLHQKMLSTLEANDGIAPCVDETALNALMFGRKDKVRLQRRWQRMSGGKQGELETNGFVIHYGSDAPWQSLHKYHHLLTDAHLIWHRFHAEARQCSVWHSMRMANGWSDIIFCRALYVLGANIGIFKRLLHAAMIARGLRNNIVCLDCYLERFDTSRVNKSLLP